MNRITLLLVVALGVMLIAPIPNPGHPASQVGPGTFAPGNFVFPNELSVGGNFIVNTDKLFVNSTSGWVGIGTTNPEHPLQVEGLSSFGTSTNTFTTRVNGTDYPEVRLQAGSSAHRASYSLLAGSTNRWTMRLNWNQAGDFRIYSNSNNDAFTMTNAGLVGINVDTATERLHVNGNILGEGNANITGNITAEGIITSEICLNGVCESSWPAGGSSMWTNSSGNATFTTGNVGIGTTTPQTTLDVDGTARIQVSDTSTAALEIGQQVFMETNPAGSPPAGATRIGQLVVINKTGAQTIARLVGIEANALHTDGTVTATVAGAAILGAQVGGTTEQVTGATVLGALDGGTAEVVTALAAPAVLFGGTTDELNAIEATVLRGAGTVTNITGIKLEIQDLAGTPSTNRRALWIMPPSGTATNDYAIFQEGAQQNYFEGSINATNGIITSEICLNGVCESSWPAGGSSMWTNSSGNATFTTGSVGIGTTTPTATLDVRGTRFLEFEDTSAATEVVGENITIITNPSSGVSSEARRLGQRIELRKDGSSEIDEIIGSEFFVGQTEGISDQTSSIDTLTYLAGGITDRIRGTRSVSWVFGGSAREQRGSISAAIAIDGNITDMAGLTVARSVQFFGNATNVTGIEILQEDDGLQQPLNRRSIWIQEPIGTATNDYAIYQEGTQTNYFEGSLGLGTTEPTARLEIDGGLRLNTTVARPTCDADQRGTFWVEQRDVGEDDFVWACLRNSTQDYNWILMARGE